MDTLSLAPLPSEAIKENRSFRSMGSEGFIDEQVVSRVIARGAYDRVCAQPEGMALSSCGDDYAGRAVPVASPFRKMEEPSTPAYAATRMPGSPRLRKEPEPGVGTPYEGGHRWWLFGMSGAMSCAIMALTFLSLAQRESMAEMPSAPVTSSYRQVAPAVAETKPAFQPSLTTVLPGER
jgi:hypothetical protein